MYTSVSTLIALLAVFTVNSPVVTDARRGGGPGEGGLGRPGGQRPGGDHQDGSPDSRGPPQDGQFQSQGGFEGQQSPQGGFGPGKGPRGVSVYSVTADKPELLGAIGKSRGVTLAPVSGLTAVYEGKINSTSPPIARRLLDNGGVPTDMVFLSSTSDDGINWTEGALLTIGNLPTDIIARKPTLSADGTKLFFVGASGDLKHTPSAIYWAECVNGVSCTFGGKAFEMPGKIISGCAYANGMLVVPLAGDMETTPAPTDPVPDPLPTVTGRRMLRKGKKKGRKPGSQQQGNSQNQGAQDHQNLATQAWVASCDFGSSSATACATNGITVQMPDVTADARGRGPSAWRGSMIFNNGKYEFYGSGKGSWPVVSSDNGNTWNRATGDAVVDVPGPDPSCALASSPLGLVCAAPGPPRRGGHDDHGDNEGSENQGLL